MNISAYYHGPGYPIRGIRIGPLHLAMSTNHTPSFVSSVPLSVIDFKSFAIWMAAITISLPFQVTFHLCLTGSGRDPDPADFQDMI